MKQRKKVKYLAIWFLLTILAFTSAIVWERSTRNVVSATSRPTIAKKKTPSVHGKKIQDIQLGERVLGKNPQANDGLDESILTEVPHVGYNLLMKKPDGTNSSIELLRPKNWLETEKVVFREISDKTNVEDPYKDAIRQKSSDGKECNIEVYIDLPEMGTTGWATLISIKDKIEIKDGPGNVVTGRFRHIANNVIDLQIEGVDKIGCTDNHPFWSEDRQDFIEAGKLIEGERVLLYSGEPRRVVQKLPRPGPQYVNNLEVFGEHVYHVTINGVLVHNDCPDANNGIGPQHGNTDHNRIIDHWIAVLQRFEKNGIIKPGSIRKNQVQVAGENVVGKNRPDIQFEWRDGTRGAIEVDRRLSSNNNHRTTITQNDRDVRFYGKEVR